MGACLPGVPGKLPRVLGRKVSDVFIGIGSMQFCCIIRILGPGGGYWEIILREEVGPVVQGQGACIPGNAVDSTAEGILVPGPGHKLIFERTSPIRGKINERTCCLKGWHDLELDLSNIWLVIGFNARK